MSHERTKQAPSDGQRHTQSPLQSTAESLSMEAVDALSLVQNKSATGIGTRRVQAAQQLSSMIGNRALLRVLEDEATAENVADDAMPAEMREFLGRGMMPGPEGRDVIGAGSGGFNAKFDPDARELIVTVNVGFVFVNGLSVDTSTGVASADGTGLDTSDPSERDTINELRTAANNLNNSTMSPEEKIADVENNWRWSDGEAAPFMERYRQSVTDAWSGRHFFVSQDWPQLMSNVRLVVNVHQGQQEGDHCKAKIVKSPADGIGAYVQRGQVNNPNDQELIMSSSDVGPAEESLLDWKLYFENNDARIETAKGQNGDPGPRFLDRFITTFDAANPRGGVPIQVIGRASTTGSSAYNQKLSEQRAANVEKYLKDQGLRGAIDRTTSTGTGEEGATEEAEWRRVDLIVGSGEGQNVAAHEFGHMIGLGDEYSTKPAPGAGRTAPGFISGTGNPVGTPVSHSDVNNRAGDVEIDGAVSENNDNIMSLGNAVRPQHYSTFHNALEIVTGKRWRYGGEGDAPDVIPGTPAPGGGVIT